MLPTITSQIAEWSTGQGFDDTNAQLCVVSVGFDVEAIASHLLRRVLEELPSLNACVSCVVLPDGTKSGTLSRVASALAASLRGVKGEDVQVHVAEEGTSTRTRCSYYQSGGVVVLCGRMLCADLLHRRVSRELVGAAVVLLPHGGPQRADSVVPSIAFCAEILLRGGGAVLLPSRRRRPPFILLSDDPCFLRHLVQRRRLGQETFLAKLHVDDLQLFPRFRLDILRHFERLAAQRPLTVERVAVGVSSSTAALDALLCHVIKEVVAELHSLDSRLGQSAGDKRSGGSSSSSLNNKVSDDDPYARMQPLSQRQRLEKQPPRYVRKPWMSPSDPSTIFFSRICDEDALDVVDRSMEDNLQCALQAHEPSWPFARLVESLLDLRRLRRGLRRLSPFAWLFSLEAALAAHTPRYTRDTAVGAATTSAAQPPDAPWTLSQHFGAIVTLAIHRIGKVQETSCGLSSSGASVEHVVLSEDEDEDEDVVCVTPKPPHQQQQQQQQQQRLLLPHGDEVDPFMEYTNRVVQSWCRDARRKLGGSSSSNGEARAEPVLLLVVFGNRALRRYVCRLTHSLGDFQTLELNGFIAAYQAKHGADIRRRVETTITEKTEAAKLRTWFIAGNDINDEDEEATGNDNDGSDAREEATKTTAVPLSQEPSFLFSQESCTTNAINSTSNSSRSCQKGATSLHQLLLSQAPLTHPSQQPGDEKEQDQNASLLNLECVSDGIALLSAYSCSSALSPLRLHVAVVDGSVMCASELISILNGTHEALTLSADDGANITATTTTTLLAPPRRCLVVEQQLRFLRLLEMAQDALPPQRLRELRVQVLVESLQETADASAAVVAAEREAFEALAHAKATLTGALLSDRDAVRAVQQRLDSALLDKGRAGRMQRFGMGRGDHDGEGDGAVEVAPLVVFDEREFRSLLPYALYCRGIDLVPLTLATADYVLSPEYALERKSVPDFIQSLQSGRIHTQLAALSRRYEHPMCLIEFDRATPFRLTFAAAAAAAPTGSSYDRPFGSGGLFTRIARLFAAFPRVHVLWSRDAAQSASIVHTMKRTCASAAVDPSAPSLTRVNVDPFDSAAAKETAHLAARVLSCFPGVTASNAPRIMALCGSLAGLATIDEASLVTAIGEAEAKQLYSFLHDNLVSTVE